MALSGGLTIEFPDGRDAIKLRFAASDAAERVLRQFACTTRELLTALGRAGGLPVELNLSYSQGEGLSFRAEEPTGVSPRSS